MNRFNSQVCISIEQSKRLLKLGLNPETADMKHYFDDKDDYPFFHHWECFPYEWNEESLVDSENIPAWSLHRLMEIAGIDYVAFEDIKNAYDLYVRLIASYIKYGLLNKEYLKQ